MCFCSSVDAVAVCCGEFPTQSAFLLSPIAMSCGEYL